MAEIVDPKAIKTADDLYRDINDRTGNWFDTVKRALALARRRYVKQKGEKNRKRGRGRVCSDKLMMMMMMMVKKKKKISKLCALCILSRSSDCIDSQMQTVPFRLRHPRLPHLEHQRLWSQFVPPFFLFLSQALLFFFDCWF